jgi:hypothetical protein
MDARDETVEDTEKTFSRATSRRRPLTAAHFEPWRGNIIDVTMMDGSHHVGLLERMENDTASMRTMRGVNETRQVSTLKMGESVAIERASRN